MVNDRVACGMWMTMWPLQTCLSTRFVKDVPQLTHRNRKHLPTGSRAVQTIQSVAHIGRQDEHSGTVSLLHHGDHGLHGFVLGMDHLIPLQRSHRSDANTGGEQDTDECIRVR